MIEHFITFGVRRRWSALAIILVLIGGSIGGLLRLQVDTSYDSLISENDPGRAAYDSTVADFGSDNTTVIYFKDKNLFDPKKLRLLEDLVVSLKEMKAVDRVESLFSAISIRDQSGYLDSRPLMDFAPETPEEAEVIKKDALFSPLIKHNLLSVDGTVTAINVTVIRDRSDPRFNISINTELEKKIEPLRASFDEVFHVGPPRLNVEIEKGMFADLSILAPLSTLVLIGFIILIIRLPIAAILPMITAGLSILMTMGFMGYMDLKLTLLTAIVPSLIIVIGSTEDMHLVASYLEGVPGKGQKPGNRVSAVGVMVHHAGLAIILSSFTTAAGFFSNGVSDIPLIQGFAVASGFGMLANFVVTVLVVPTMLSIFGPQNSPLHTEGKSAAKGPIGVIINLVEVAVRDYGKVIAISTLLLVGIFSALSMRVHVSNDPLSYFPSDHPLVMQSEALHKDLAGMQIFYVTLSADYPNAFRDPINLKKLEAVTGYLKGMGVYDNVTSLADYLSLVNREMHNGDAAFWHVPDTRNLVEQFLLLFSEDDISRYINSDFSRANILVRHNMSDSHELNMRLADLQAALPGLTGSHLTFQVTGENLMINRAAEGLFTGQVKSLALMGGIIFILMSILYVSVYAGFMFLIPNFIPLVLNFGTMALLDIPLNPGTASVAAIALGIAVDDSIHLFARFRSEIRKVGDPEIAVQNTVRGEAVAVVTTSVSLMAMYATLLFSNFEIVKQFGLLAGLTMVYALFSDLLITPMILKRVGVVGIFEIANLKLAREIIAGSPLFAGMSKYQIKKTILLFKTAVFEEGERIMSQGETGREMYVILSGQADVVINGTKVTVCGPGDVLGEFGFLSESKRTASVSAVGKVEALVVNADAVDRGLRFNPLLYRKFTSNVSRILGQRIAEILEQKGAK